MNEFVIYDKSIFYLGKKEKKVNGIGVIAYYFNRLTRTSMIPIEIIAAKFKDEVILFSPQLNEYTLEQTEEIAMYYNSIKFYKQNIGGLIDNIKNKSVKLNTIDIFKDIFAIDLSGIKGIDGLVFDRIIYTENFKVKNTELRADGYMFIFTDAALRRTKLGFFAGNLRNKRYSEFVDDLNEYGASNILDGVSVVQKDFTTKITNNTPFQIEVQPYATKYNIEAKLYGERVYTRERKATDMIILYPGQEFTLYNDNPQADESYTMYNNKPAEEYVNEPFSNLSDEYQTQKNLLISKPYEFKILKVGVKPVVSYDIENYALITGMSTIDKLDDINYAIVHKENDTSINIKSDMGYFTIDSMKVAYNVSPEGMKNRLIKGFANTALFRIDSEQFIIDYTFNNAQTIITEIAYKNAFNNITSEYMPSLVVKTATLADYDEFAYQNEKIKVDRTVYGGALEALPVIMKSDLFKHDVVMVDLNEISEMSSRPPYGQYIFKSFVKELDDVIAEFMTKRKQAISNFKFMDIPLDISTADISEFSPENKIWSLSGKEGNNFVYNIKKHLADLGYEIALEEALKRLKKAAYIFSPVKNVIATNVFGVTLDHKWYFMGSNWYLKDEVETPKITTYIDDKIKEYDVPVNKYRFMYVKKIFFGYDNDTNQMVSYAKAFAECIGMDRSIPSDLLIQNAALMYIMEHTIDNERTYPEYNEVVTYPTEFVNKYTEKDLKNKYVFPNIFKQQYNTSFHAGLYSSARKAELDRFTENNALDVLNSVEKLEVNTSAFLLFDQDALKELTGLFIDNSYHILGIADNKFTTNEIVKFIYNVAQDIYMGDDYYHYGAEIFINNERRFGLYYNIETKKSKLFLADETIVTDYSFMVGMFDAMLLYQIDRVGPYVYKDVGVFSLPEELGATEIADEYLYLPIEHPIQSNYNLCGVAINYLEQTIFLDMHDRTESKMRYNLGKNTDINKTINISAKVQGDELVISKGEYSQVSIPLISLRNLPTKSMTYNGFVIKPFKLSRFLPSIYADSYLREMLISLEYNGNKRYATIKFGEPTWVEIGNKKILIGLDSRGLVYGINIGNHMADLKTLLPIEEILSSETVAGNSEIKIKIVSIEGGSI